MIHYISVSIFVILAKTVSSTQEQPSCSLNTRPEPFQIKNNFTDWEEKYILYNPPDWTVPCEEEICDKIRPEHITFGEMWNGVDRRRAKSCFIRPKYKVNYHGRPLNPAGRTGIAGRGELPKWGPNHLVKLILHRRHNGRDYSLQDEYKFPEFFVNTPSSHWFDKETEHRLLESMRDAYTSAGEAEKAIRKVEKKSKKLLRGSVPNPKNTDNAWIEMHIRSVECSEHEHFCKAMATEFEGRGFQWVQVNKTSAPEHRLESQISRMGYETIARYSAFCRILMKYNAIIRAPGMFGLGLTLNSLTIGAAALVLIALVGFVNPVLLYIMVGAGILSLILITSNGVLRGQRDTI